MADQTEKVLLQEVSKELKTLTDIMSNAKVLNGGFDRLVNKVDSIANDVENIKEKMDEIYKPDSGLYARVKELETWKNITSKIIWLVLAVLISSATLSIWNVIKLK